MADAVSMFVVFYHCGFCSVLGPRYFPRKFPPVTKLTDSL